MSTPSLSLSQRLDGPELEALLGALHRVQGVVEFDLLGNILAANAVFLATMGYAAEELIGQHHSVLCDSEDVQGEAYRRFWETLRSGAVHAGEVNRRHHSGRTVVLQASYNPVIDHRGRILKIVKFATDVTEARRASAELSGTLRAIDRSQGMIEFDLDAHIRAVNDNFVAMVDWPREELLGQHHRVLCEPAHADSPEYLDFWRRLGAGEFITGEFPRRARDGREVWIQASYNPVFDARGRVVKVIKFATDVTPVRRASAAFEALMQAVNRVQAVVEFDLRGTVLHANENFLRLFGYSAAEVEGQHHRMFCEPDYAASPAYADFWRQLARGDLRAGEFQRRGRDGREVWIQASYNPVLDAMGRPVRIVKFATDISARKASERLVARTREALELSNAAARIGTWEHDVAADRTELSLVAREVLGIAADAAPSLTQIAELSRPPGELRLALDQALETAKGWDLELQVHAGKHVGGGEPRWVRAIGRAEARRGRVVRLFGTFQDIESQKRREMAEAAARSKDMFLAMMSHELRTPMNAVLGFADLLRRSGRLAAEDVDTVDEITRAGHLLLRLINDVLDLSRLEAEGAAMALTPVALAPVFEECSRLMAEQALRAEVSLAFERPDPPLWVRAHPLRMRQVMLNLVSNAVKYNRPRGQVQVRCVGAGVGWTRIEVSDTGRGIPADQFDRVFRPFERLGAENTEIPGTGIGLSIVKRLVTQMGGEVGLSSVVGQGSTFWVTLHAEAVGPAAEAAATEALPAPLPAPIPATPASGPAAAATARAGAEARVGDSRGHLLVAEDNPVNRKVIGRQLSMLGFTAEFDEDGQKAFERWRADPARFELVLTDLQMPVLDGYGLAEAIRGSGLPGHDVPVIILSANVFEGEAEGWRRHGVDAYLTKPVDAPGLERALEQGLALARCRRE